MTPRESATAQLEDLAEAIRTGAMPIPTHIDVWHTKVSTDDLISRADSLGRHISITPDYSHIQQATVRHRPSTLPIPIDVHYISADMCQAARDRYAAYNQAHTHRSRADR